MSILKVSNLHKTYKGRNKLDKTEALNGINFEINKGEFIGIMGPSGSGKTTLLNVLSGIARYTSGSIEILEENIQNMSRSEMAEFRSRHLGFVFQDFNLLNSLTIKENIMLPLSIESNNSEDYELDNYEERTISAMKMLKIDTIANKYPYLISGGQQQRAAIARAIINNPDIIFADEPTGNLDWNSSTIVMDHFEKLNIHNNDTILVVTHDPFTARYCNRIIFIKKGEIYSEINKNKKTKNEFFYDILDILRNIGDDQYEL